MSAVRSWLQLMRIGNVFTAVADILGGALFIGAGRFDLPRVVVASLASALLYTAGTMLNDFFDFRKDLVERPFRPLPSGAIRLRSAALAGAIMLFVGWSLTLTISRPTAVCGTGLALAILLYDWAVKNTPLAPLIMGTCRALNLALGMLTVGTPWGAPHYVAVGLMLLYITSVTFFARREAAGSARLRLAIGWLGVSVAVAGLVVVAELYRRLAVTAVAWHAMAATAALLVVLAAPAVRSLWQPTPPHVQAAVKAFVLSIILFDAVLVLLSRGPVPALALATLLIPAALLGRVFRPT